MPPTTTARRPFNGVDQNRRASGRQIRTSISRPTNYYARPFGSIGAAVEEPQDDEPPGFFPAIQAFSDTIATLPKEVQRHITLSKEADAKIYAPMQAMVQVAGRIAALPPPPPSHRLAAQQGFLTFTANNSTGQNSASNSILNGNGPGFVTPSVAEAVKQLSQPTPEEQQAEVERRQEFYNLRMVISQVLTHLDEKNVCLADANRTLDKQLARVDKIMPHIHTEISEEARLGSTTHWAYADNRKKNLPAHAPEKSRRDVAATSMIAAAAATVHGDDIAAARSGADTKKSRGLHVDSEFEERGAQKKSQNKGKRVANNTVESKAGASAASAAGQPQKKRKVEKVGGTGMERSASTAKHTKASAATTNVRSTPAAEAAKKKSKPAVPSLPRKKQGMNGSPAMSPQNAGSPTMASFALESNGQRPGSRMRQSSSSFINNKLAKGASASGDRRAGVERKPSSADDADMMDGVEHSTGGRAGADHESNSGEVQRTNARLAGAPTSHPDTNRPVDSVEMVRTRSNGVRGGTGDGFTTHAGKSSAARTSDRENGTTSMAGNTKRSHGRSGSSQHILKQIASFNRSPTMGRRELPSGTDESSTGGDDEAAPSTAARPRRIGRSLRRQTSRLRSTDRDDDEDDENDDDVGNAGSEDDEQQQPELPGGANGVSSHESVANNTSSRGREERYASDPTADEDRAPASERPRAARSSGRGRVEEEDAVAPDAVAGVADRTDEINDEDYYGGNNTDEDPGGEEPKYCYCERESFGTMIGCENDDCPRQWFHLSCVGMSKPPEDNVKWYCDYCIDASRKSKKKGGGRH